MGGLALWDGSIVSTCGLDCQEGLGEDQGLSSQGSPVGTILPSLTLLPCAQVSSCRPEAWLKLESPEICMAATQKWVAELEHAYTAEQQSGRPLNDWN